MLTTIPFHLVRTAARTAALALAAVAPLPAAGDEPLALAGRDLERVEQQANVHSASTQEQAALGRDAAGRSVLAWQSKRQEPDGSFGIYARRFAADGTPLGGEVHVNLRAEGAQLRPAVALAASGAAWLAWESYGQDGDRGGVVLRRLAPDLGAGTNELLVDTVRDGHQAEPAVAVDCEGRALVVWTGPAAPAPLESTGGEPAAPAGLDRAPAVETAIEASVETDPRARVVRARLYAPDATPLGAPFVVPASGPGVARLPAVEADPRGGFQVAFAHTDLEGRPLGVALARIEPSGAVAGVRTVVAGPAIEPALAVDPDGRALVAWMDGRGGDWRPALRTMSAGGDPARGPELLLELEPDRADALGVGGHASGLGVALDVDGSALVAWSLLGRPEGSAVLVQSLRIDEDGTLRLRAPALRASAAEVEGDRRLAVGGPRRLAPAADGSLALAWSGAGPGDGSGVHLTLLAPEVGAGTAALDAPEDALALEAAEPHEPPVFTGPVDPALAAVKSSLSGPDHGFAAITQTSLTPPDPHVSAGPDHVVVVTNGRLAFYERDGTETFSQSLDGGGGFFASVGAASGFIFDPETLYDPHSGRFMVMANERNVNAFFLLGVSDDSDPNGTWRKYRFDVTAAVGDTDIDSPNFAVDDEVVYLTADFFGPDKFLIYMVEKAPLLSGAGTPITRSLVVNGSQSYGVPVTYDAGAPAQYLLEAFESFSNTSVRFHAVTNPLGIPQRQTVDLGVPTYTQPEDPPQQGTSVRPNTFESRFWSCMYRDGSLWATHHVNSTQVRQRWYEFAMNGWPQSGQTPTLAQWGEVVPAEGVRTFFGSIWADADGNAGLAFARSSPTEFISFSRAFRRAGDPPGQMTAAVAMQDSTEPDTSGRWGDYSGTVADPEAPGAFWTCGEYKQAGIWRTWVGLMGPCEPPSSYCTAKPTSTGSLPSVGFVGEPSVGVDDFHVTLSGGLPGKSGIAFYGAQPASNPFFGGTKCVANPVKRTPLFQLDASGSASVAVPVTLGDLGQTRYYQFWFRDPQHPDGTTVGLSDGLRVTFCP